MVGCTTTQGRFDHRAKAQRVDCCKNNQTVNRQHHGEKFQHDSVRERYAEAGRRLRIAVEEGKLTKEEAKEKFAELRKRAGEGKDRGDRGQRNNRRQR